MVVVVVSRFNGTSTPKGSYSAKTGDNDCNANPSRHSPSTALCESNQGTGEVGEGAFLLCEAYAAKLGHLELARPCL